MGRYETIRAELAELYVLAFNAIGKGVAGYEARIARLEAEANVVLHLEAA
jgi:hypothetical protein